MPPAAGARGVRAARIPALPRVRPTERKNSTRATELRRPRRYCVSGPLVAVDAISGVEMNELHLAMGIRLLEYLLEMAAGGIL